MTADAERPAPPITDALRAQAKAHPGEWVYAIDPGFDGSASVPPEGIVGAWHADAAGELTGEFMPNPRYVATPQARGWSEPSTALERVLQLVVAGYAPVERLRGEFAASDVVVFSRPEGGLFLAPAVDGSQLVYAYSDAGKATASGYSEHRTVTGRELAEAVPEGVRIALNPGIPASAVLERADILAL